MVRIGSVPYLNARPLLKGLVYPITKLVPAELCEEFAQGRLDAALLSSVDALKMSDSEFGSYVVDGVAIASRGAVYSVILAYSGELQSLTEIQLDPSSHTSNALLQIILSEFYKLEPKYVQLRDQTNPDQGRILIGDPAIDFRRKNASSALKILDLGEEWYRFTGFSFVYALWILRKEFTEKKSLSDLLRSSKIQGLGHLPEIAACAPDPDFALRYFIECIDYDLGEREKQGLRLFQELLIKYQFLPSRIQFPFFV